MWGVCSWPVRQSRSVESLASAGRPSSGRRDRPRGSRNRSSSIWRGAMVVTVVSSRGIAGAPAGVRGGVEDIVREEPVRMCRPQNVGLYRYSYVGEGLLRWRLSELCGQAT